MDLRLVAYAPNGARLGFLPQPLALDASLPLNDVPAMTVRYSRAALGGGILRRGLEQGLEVALQVNHSGDWVEPDGCRFVLIERNVDTLDDSDVVTLTMPGYGRVSSNNPQTVAVHQTAKPSAARIQRDAV